MIFHQAQSDDDVWLEQASSAAVAAPPDDVTKRFKLDITFYRKHVDVLGLPVVGSAKVSDAAMLEAAYIARMMLRDVPDVVEALVKARVRLTVMATTEMTTDVPEHRDLEKTFDRRARGVGATPTRPSSSCAEENLLKCPGDPYWAENILIHEFGHTIHLMGHDAKFNQKVVDAYSAAVKAGRWQNTYAATDHKEYWAEGVQSYFCCNPAKPDASHNEVNTRDELREYDPALFALIDDAFKSPSWKYVPPTERTSQPHLRNLDRSTLPTFAWPQ